MIRFFITATLMAFGIPPCSADELTTNTRISDLTVAAASPLQQSELIQIEQAFFATGLVPVEHSTMQVSRYESPHPDAFLSAEGMVQISSGLLRQIQSIDELAFVLAHELAHRILGQSGSHSEEEADVLAVQLVSAAGFQDTAGVTLLHRVCHSVPVAMRTRPKLLRRAHTLEKLVQSTKKIKPIRIKTADIIRDTANRFY